MRSRAGALVVAALTACSPGGDPAKAPAASDAGSRSSEAKKKMSPPVLPGDLIRGSFLIATPESEATQKELARRLAAAKTEAERAMLAAEADLNAFTMPTQATVSGSHLVLRRAGAVVLDTTFRLVHEDAAGVEIVLDQDGGPSVRFDVLPDGALRAAALAAVAGGEIWARRALRD